MGKVNVIHPGYVRSKNDGESHYVGFYKLIDLYGLDENTCIDFRDRGYNKDNAKHFYPDPTGKYNV